METTGSFKQLIFLYQGTRCHIPPPKTELQILQNIITHPSWKDIYIFFLTLIIIRNEFSIHTGTIFRDKLAPTTYTVVNKSTGE